LLRQAGDQFCASAKSVAKNVALLFTCEKESIKTNSCRSKILYLKQSMKQRMSLGFLILGILFLAIAVSIHFNLLSARPFVVKWYGVIASSLLAILLGFIAFSHDSSSSLKTDNILTNTQTAGVKIDSILTENGSLKSQVNQLEDAVLKKNETIIALTHEAADLTKRLSEKTKEIYDVSKAIRFPIPDVIGVGYQLFFQLEEPFQSKADSILKKHNKFEDLSAYSSVQYDLISSELGWTDYISDWIRVTFAKDFGFSKSTYHSTPLASFSNLRANTDVKESLLFFKKTLMYNPTNKEFLIEVRNAQLPKQWTPNLSLKQNLANTSIFDLANSTVIFHQSFPSRFKFVHISHFNIFSPELNLNFWEMKNTENPGAFTAEVNLVQPKK
jgi:hypothetical protein